MLLLYTLYIIILCRSKISVYTLIHICIHLNVNNMEIVIVNFS